MRIINTATPLPLDQKGQLALYSGLDVLTLFEISDALAELMGPEQKQIYEFELDLQAPLLEMSLNGILVDTQARSQMVRKYKAQLDRVNAAIHRYCEAIGYYDYYLMQAVLRFHWATGIPVTELPRTWEEWKARPVQWRRKVKALNEKALALYQAALKAATNPFNAASPAQKLQLFYDFFGHYENLTSREISPDFYPPWSKSRGISEYKARNSKGVFVPTTNREALEKIRLRGLDGDKRDAHFWALPFVNACLEIMDLTKALGFLQAKLENGYYKSAFGTVTETGRLASRANAQGYGGNAQNVTPKLRHIFTCPAGYKMAAPDYEQIEARIVGAICFRLFGATSYLDATECGDLHSLVVSMVWPNLGWPADFSLDALRKYGKFPADILKAAKKIASVKFYRDFSRRDLCKRLGHGSNYRGKPAHMAKLTHIELALVEHFQEAYFSVFPELRDWHTWVAGQVQTTGVITTMLGRHRRFFGRPTDDATLREAIAYEPQSVAADYTNGALLRLFRAYLDGSFPAKLILQKHDEIGVVYRESDESNVLAQMGQIMEQQIMLRAPDGSHRAWFVPVDTETGWNLGKRSDKNPDGLADPSLRRARKRLPQSLLKTLQQRQRQTA